MKTNSPKQTKPVSEIDIAITSLRKPRLKKGPKEESVESQKKYVFPIILAFVIGLVFFYFIDRVMGNVEVASNISFDSIPVLTTAAEVNKGVKLPLSKDLLAAYGISTESEIKDTTSLSPLVRTYTALNTAERKDILAKLKPGEVTVKLGQVYIGSNLATQASLQSLLKGFGLPAKKASGTAESLIKVAKNKKFQATTLSLVVSTYAFQLLDENTKASMSYKLLFASLIGVVVFLLFRKLQE